MEVVRRQSPRESELAADHFTEVRADDLGNQRQQLRAFANALAHEVDVVIQYRQGLRGQVQLDFHRLDDVLAAGVNQLDNLFRGRCWLIRPRGIILPSR